MEKTFDELTDFVYERNGCQNWRDVRVVYLGVSWSVKHAFLHDKQHHLVLAHDIFKAGVCFPRLKKLREVFNDTWLLTEEKVERPTMPPTFYSNDNVGVGEMCQIFGGIGQLSSPNISWPQSSMGVLERGDIAIALGVVKGEKGVFMRVLTRLGVGFIVSDILAPAPSSLYLNL